MDKQLWRDVGFHQQIGENGMTESMQLWFLGGLVIGVVFGPIAFVLAADLYDKWHFWRIRKRFEAERLKSSGEFTL